MATTKKVTKKAVTKKKKPATSTAKKKADKSKLLIKTAEEIAAEEEKIANKWDNIFDRKLGQLVLFKGIRDKKQKVYGWAAEDGFFLRGIKHKNEIFAENLGWPDMEMCNNNNDDPIDEAKRRFKKPIFTTEEELWIFDAKECMVFPHNTANEKVAQKFNSLLGDDLTLQTKHMDLVDELGSKHKKIESNLDQIDAVQLKIMATLKAFKK
ncbi:MAG: hypothetical protein V4635_06185 [Bacteroidota bacterium]